ncbi:MAG: hypothetical protein L0219_02635, partial [Phycisphaerales bacterium]|nr:hypothetical protein [Phycisphaerales bacterium]
MIGHNDQFDSIGSVENFAIIDNVRVVRLGQPAGIDITGIQVANNTVQIDFTAPGGQAGDFQIESSATLSPPSWSQENSATIAPQGNGFRATLAASGPTRFYRVRR